ncbi:hypothetical protein SAMN05877809_11251 [Rhodobacter sp. JA431]|uniref:hypothetical protein n=1 Tax=Rhodobacter sp. JA431 TaxID=570013 RepID=UPI000BDB7AF0|nr:hypothetical protein [Rhodobacter sp. JA431]SOC20522.1 hypothetical protein SAMN05877809_11251 [Rhodobacter sp. JA431]
MTLPTNAPLPFAKTRTRPLLLGHKLRVLRNTQNRLKGRVALVPELDLRAYRFRAVFDWIEFRVHFTKQTQARYVQDVLRRFLDRDSHITPADEGLGGVFTECRIKVQEPPSMAVVTAIHKALQDTFGEASQSRVTGMEISVDAYPTEPADNARATLLGAMQRTIWTDRSIWAATMSRPRSVFAKGKKGVQRLVRAGRAQEPDLLGFVPEDHMPPAIDGTMYLGAKTDPVMIRLMDKVIDTQHPTTGPVQLEEDRQRVRIEATLKDGELGAIGVSDIASLKILRPSKLQKRYFQFKLPTFSQDRKVTRGVELPFSALTGQPHWNDQSCR